MVDNQELLQEVLFFKETNKMSDNLLNMLYDIAKNIISQSNWIRYTWREDMISYSLYNCLKYGKNFKQEIDYSNIYSYFYTIIENSYKHYIKEQKKNLEIKQKLSSDKGFLQEKNSINDFNFITVDNKERITVNDIKNKEYTVDLFNIEYTDNVLPIYNPDNVNSDQVEYYFWLFKLWINVCKISYRDIGNRTECKKSTIQNIISGKKVSIKTLYQTYYQLKNDFPMHMLNQLPIFLNLKNNLKK